MKRRSLTILEFFLNENEKVKEKEILKRCKTERNQSRKRCDIGKKNHGKMRSRKEGVGKDACGGKKREPSRGWGNPERRGCRAARWEEDEKAGGGGVCRGERIKTARKRKDKMRGVGGCASPPLLPPLLSPAPRWMPVSLWVYVLVCVSQAMNETMSCGVAIVPSHKSTLQLAHYSFIASPLLLFNRTDCCPQSYEAWGPSLYRALSLATLAAYNCGSSMQCERQLAAGALTRYWD